MRSIPFIYASCRCIGRVIEVTRGVGGARAALLAVAIALALPAAAAGELTVALPAGDGMVIQRAATVPLAGTAAAKAEVVVTIAGRRVATRSDAAGSWRAELTPLPAGGPHELTVAAGGEQLLVHDVLVGDVWVCSGQSNMEWVVADSADAER